MATSETPVLRGNPRKTKELNYQELNQLYEDRTASVRCWCSIATKCVGGVPADRKALLAFAEHHLGIADPAERDRAVDRILKEEVGERDITPELGEVEEKQVYGVNVVRRTDGIGPWLGDWMVKACVKQAASRLGVFTEIRGSKGNFAEAGRVRAIDQSLREPQHPERIYVMAPDHVQPAKTYFEEFMGRVQSPRGAASIIHHSECIEPGSTFAFEFRFLVGKVKMEDISEVIAMAMNMGLGSVRSMECGKFKIERCVIELEESVDEPKKPKKNAKAEEAEGEEAVANGNLQEEHTPAKRYAGAAR